MARQALRIGGEDHRPGHVAFDRAAPQLGIDEIRQPAKQHAQPDIDGNVVAHAQEGQPTAQADPADRQHHADQPAMEAHAAIPYTQHAP